MIKVGTENYYGHFDEQKFVKANDRSCLGNKPCLEQKSAVFMF